MGLLDEPGLERLVGAGCTACGSHKLTFRAFVDGLLPIMEAEPVGRLTWVYDGEKFVDGVFEVTCSDCKAPVFAESVCPRCHAPGGLARALAAPNRWPVPQRCPGCDGEELRYIALVPARVTYEGKRAEKARSSSELHDAGFHWSRTSSRAARSRTRRSVRGRGFFATAAATSSTSTSPP